MSGRLLESGDELLIESGSFRLLEIVDGAVEEVVVETARPGGRGQRHWEPDHQTRAFWEREEARLRILLDDDELVAIGALG